jgi:hypothetical protein
MENIFGGLIEFESEKEFDEYMKKMTPRESLVIIEKAIEYAYMNNLFTQQETYCIYKSIKNLKDDEKEIL